MTVKITSADFRQTMGSFATGVAVASLRDAEMGPVGLTINSLTSVSLEPALVLFCIEESAFLHKAFRHTDYFSLNFLARSQEDVSRYFADRHHNAKPKNLWDKPRQGQPILRGTLGWLVCRAHAFYKGGDHTIVVGEVIALHRSAIAKEPLLYYHGRYRDLAPAKLTSGARK